MQKFPLIVLILIIAAIIALGGGVFYFTREYSPAGQHCGGFIQNAPTCPAGYVCQLGKIPDTGGTCVKAQDANIFCGGIAAFPCPTGYVCKFDGAYPDAGGHCVVPDGTGTLRGQVAIGPNCPVERIDNPCVTPPEAYASREFLVTQNGRTIISFHADMSGAYLVSLPPGTYTVVSAKTGIGFMSKDLPATIIIRSGESAILNISVDTGIR